MAGNSYATMVELDGSPNKSGLRGPSVIGERHQYTTKCPFRLKCGTWIQLLGNDVGKVRKTPSWPRSWANLSLLQLYSHSQAWAN